MRNFLLGKPSVLHYGLMALVWAGGIVYDQYEENRNSRIGAEISTESVDPDSSGLASPYDYWDGNDRSAPRAGEKQPRSLQKSRRNRQVDRQSRTSGPEEEHTESEEERIQRELERHRKEARALEELAISEFDAASKRDERRRQRNKAAIIRAASRADTGERHSGRNKRAGSSRTAGKGGSGNHGRSQEPREQRKVSESGSGQGGKGTEGDTDSPETETGHGGSYAAAGKQTEEREDCESEASHAASRRYTLLSGDEDSGNGWEPGGGTDTGAEDDPGQAGDTGGGGNETYLLEEHKTFTVYSEVGYVVPAAGEHLILEDYEVAAWVKYDTERVGDTRYRCAGWTGTGDVPGSGNGDSVTFTMSQDSSITWNWTKEYLLDTGVSGSGSVDTADKWCEPGKVMQITAAPSRGWLFSHWSGDVTSESNPLSVRMNRPLEVTAVFEEERPDDGNSAPAPVYMDTDTTWSSGQPHYLSAPVIVRNGATLTIEPGAVIRSEPSGSLVIARGSRIEAMGTREAPIVMTDLHDDHMVGTDPSPGTYPYNLRNNGIGGRWGGLILLGDAFVTTDAGEPDVYSPDPSLELELDGYEDIGAFYGGGDDNDGSGELHFVSIRYAGLAPDGKGRVPGLTLAGVGRNTTVDNVEVFQCAGDGFSFLGGTVGTRYLQSWSAGGDAFHWDYGYRGKGQFWFGLQGILSSIGEVSDKACEMRGGPGQALLSSCPTIHNATFIGLGADSGNQGNTCLHFADGSGGRFRNMIAMDFGGAVALIEGSPSNSIYDASDNCYNSYFHDPLYSHVYAGSRILEIEGSFFWNFGFGNAKGLPLDSAFAGEWGAAYDARGPYHGLETGFDLIESGVMNCYQNGSAGYRSPLKQIEFEQQPVSVHGHEYYPISHIDPRIRDRRYIKAGWRASAVDEFFTPVCFQGAFHKDNWADWTAAAGLGMLATEGINADDYEQTGPDHFVMEIRRDSDFVSFQMDIDSVLEGTLVELFVFYRRSDDGRLYFYDFTTGRWHYRGTRSKAMALGDLELRNILDVRAPDADGGLGASPLPPDSEVHMYIDLRPNGLCDYPWLGAEHERLGDLQPDHS